MRITLTTLIIAFLFALGETIISPTYWTFGDLIMRFGFIIIPLFICVCVFHFVLNIYKWTNQLPSLIIQILILWLIYNLLLLSISFPDFLRHQNNQGYVRYKSYAEYFETNILESFIIATIFSFTIPLLDKFLKNKIDKLKTRDSSDKNTAQQVSLNKKLS